MGRQQPVASEHRRQHVGQAVANVNSGDIVSIQISSDSRLYKYPAREHAARVAAALGISRGLIYLPGAKTRLLEDSDQSRPFRQRRYFYYLSGVDEADCYITYDVEREDLCLWLPPINPRQVVWVGRGSTTEEAKDKYDIKTAAYSTVLDSYLELWSRRDLGDIYVLHPGETPDVLSECRDTSSTRSELNDWELQPAMDRCRVIKDSFEVDLIKRANAVSAKAHKEVLRHLLKFDNESQVQARFLDVCVAHGAKHQSYDIIAGSGENAAILHYIKNDEKFGNRQLMCLDAGAEWECYASDVTRTFPLSGTWPSPEAESIYNLVQEMQTVATYHIGPGKSFVEAHHKAHQVAVNGLLKLGILHNGTHEEIYKAGTTLAFFPHGLGHHMGLEVHDVSPTGTIPLTNAHTDLKSCSEQECAETLPELVGTQWITYFGQPGIYRAPCHASSPPLQPGMVITVEPGIYFNRYALERIFLPDPRFARYINKEVLERYMPVGGVRIEDNFLVTDKGVQNLTTAPKGEEALRVIRGEV